MFNFLPALICFNKSPRPAEEAGGREDITGGPPGALGGAEGAEGAIGGAEGAEGAIGGAMKEGEGAMAGAEEEKVGGGASCCC